MLRSSAHVLRNPAHRSRPLKFAPRVKAYTTGGVDSKGEDDVASKIGGKDDEPAPLKLLSRPLGVANPPVAHTPTWADTREALMDQDKRLAHREHLVKEAGKGYFADLNATRKHGGKTWIAPSVMIRENMALYFPDVVGTSIDTKEKKHTTDICKGRVSVISMLSSKISEIQVDGFVAPSNKEYMRHPLYQYIQINLQENLLKSFLVSLFTASIRAHVPPELHPTYLVSGQNMEYYRQALGLTNKHVGYVYLVDPSLKVRWAACADARPEEADALYKCVAVLLRRLEQNEATASSPHPTT